jgi:hypothetical protein
MHIAADVRVDTPGAVAPIVSLRLVSGNDTFYFELMSPDGTGWVLLEEFDNLPAIYTDLNRPVGVGAWVRAKMDVSLVAGSADGGGSNGSVQVYLDGSLGTDRLVTVPLASWVIELCVGITSVSGIAPAKRVHVDSLTFNWK